MISKRQLGSTNLQLSLIGLGTVKFGRNTAVKYPSAFELPSIKQISELLELAQSLGINTLDTAPSYGSSEERLGLIFSQNTATSIARDNWILITKAGEEFENNQSIYNFSANYINNSINKSLKTLGTDHIDIFLIHSDGSDHDIAENDSLWQILETRKKMGDILSYGVSSKTVNGGLNCLKRSDLAMVTYRKDYTDELPILDYATQNNKGILLKKVLNSGHSVHKNKDTLQEELQYCADHPAVTSMIIGTINPDHLINNINALNANSR